MFKSLDARILGSLRNSESEVLKFIENNKKKVLKMTVQELSQNTYVSTATIIRLCKKIELSGFSELKYKIREEIEKQDASIKEISSLGKISKSSLYDIQQSYNLISTEDVNKIVDLLLQDRNIHFFGKGLTSTALKYVSKHLLTCNRLNICYEDTHIAYLAAEVMSEKDVLFVGSLSGKTPQIIKMVRIAKSKGATVVAVTNIDNNIISEMADINLKVYVNESIDSTFDMKSRVSILFVFNIIVNMYVEKRKSLQGKHLD